MSSSMLEGTKEFYNLLKIFTLRRFKYSPNINLEERFQHSPTLKNPQLYYGGITNCGKIIYNSINNALEFNKILNKHFLFKFSSTFPSFFNQILDSGNFPPSYLNSFLFVLEDIIFFSLFI